MNTSDPQAIASAYGLPANNGTYHILAVLKALEENQTPALLTAITDNSKDEYEALISMKGLASERMIAAHGLRYGVFVLLLASVYEEKSGPDAEPHDPHIEAIKLILQRGARNLAQMYLHAVEEEGNG